MDRTIDRLIVKYVLKLSLAQESESYIEGWLHEQNFYSANLTDAMQLLESFDSYSIIKMNLQNQYQVTVGENQQPIYHQSAPMAIALAALASAAYEGANDSETPWFLYHVKEYLLFKRTSSQLANHSNDLSELIESLKFLHHQLDREAFTYIRRMVIMIHDALLKAEIENLKGEAIFAVKKALFILCEGNGSKEDVLFIDRSLRKVGLNLLVSNES